MKTIYIIDGHSLIYRAYYAFIGRPLITAKGENTSAIFGFMRMMIKLIQDERPEYLVCAFDARGPTFRHERYPEYKAKRMKAPEDLHQQAEIIRSLMDGLGIARAECEGYEADDVIGTLCLAAESAGIHSIVLSGDKDILQLVGGNVTVYANRRGISEIDVIDGERVEEMWGVPPQKMTDLLALMGDQSDNVPGVRGIGKKSAVKLLTRFSSIDDLYANLAEVESERTRKLLEENRENAFMSRDLVTIRRDTPVDMDMEDCLLDKFPGKAGLEMLLEKELKTIAEDLQKLAPEKRVIPEKPQAAPSRGHYRVISTVEEYRALEKIVLKRGRVSFDTESTSTDPVTARVIGVSMSVEEGEGFYIPIRSREGTGFTEDFISNTLKELLENEKIEKKGQNIKYDYVILLKYGVRMKGITGDSMIAAYLINPLKGRYGLDALAKDLLDYETIHYTDLVKEKDGSLLDCSLEEVGEYAGEDSDIALRLVTILEGKLEEEKLGDLYREIEVPLIEVLGRMENTGVRVDPDCLKTMSIEFEDEIGRIEGKIYDLAGETFNVRSTKQLSHILFEKLKLPALKKTKTGYSTNESVLDALSKDYELPGLVIRHRTLSKLKSTYIDSLPAMIKDETGRIHTSFNQTVTATGRLSSNAPNLQNIPIREKEGRAIRRAFIPEEGWFFLSADYSQIELRILAALSGDGSLVRAFREGRDIHRETAALLFGIDEGEVNDGQRQAAKTINFSIIYGISAFGLSRRLKISRNEASRFIQTYFLKYGGVRDFFDGLVNDAKIKGYVETVAGRKRYIPEINSANRNIYEAARRIAINTPIQGTAADLIKKAMIDIDRDLLKGGLRSRMIIQVHDELVFESPSDEIEELRSLVRERMENAISLDVPLKVNIAVGKNWEEAH